jgi:cobalt transporter subunit CbtA
MLTRVLWVGLVAGLLAGLLIALLQQVTTTPLILLAETYEEAGAAAPAPATAADATKAHDHAAHDHGWSPSPGLPRFFFTAVTTIATAIGMSLLLMAGMIFAGDDIDERRALAWGIAGFVATGLAPAAGLAPELPGSGAGELIARQAWWIGTAVATSVALWGFLRVRHPAVRIGAVVLLLAPHVIGAPHPHALESKVPGEIAAQFAALSLVLQGLLWTSAGLAVGLLWPRLSPRSAGRPASP